MCLVMCLCFAAPLTMQASQAVWLSVHVPYIPNIFLTNFMSTIRCSFLTSRGCFLNNAGSPGRVVHRVALFDGYGQVSSIISQLDIIK